MTIIVQCLQIVTCVSLLQSKIGFMASQGPTCSVADCRSLVKTLVSGVKTITWGAASCKAPNVGELYTSFNCSYSFMYCIFSIMFYYADLSKYFIRYIDIRHETWSAIAMCNCHSHKKHLYYKLFSGRFFSSESYYISLVEFKILFCHVSISIIRFYFLCHWCFFHWCFFHPWWSLDFNVSTDITLVQNKQFLPHETLVYVRLLKYALQALDIYTINMTAAGQPFVRPAT